VKEEFADEEKRIESKRMRENDRKARKREKEM